MAHWLLLSISLDVLKFQTKVWKCFSCCCSEVLVFSSQRDYPLRSYANPCPIVRVMLKPWNNSVAERLWITLLVFCQAAPHCHEILVVSSVRSVWGCFWRSCSSAGYVRGLERTCVMCVKGCPVEWELVWSVPAPYLSHPSLVSGFATLFLFLPLYLSHISLSLHLSFCFNTQITTKPTLCPISYWSANTHLESLSPFFFHSFLSSSVNYTHV